MKNETGRSMVEMLAVLAIIGVITVGGLLGYQTAMRKFRANEITELIAELSVTAQTNNECVTKNTGLPECLTTVIGYPQGQVQLTFQNTGYCKNMVQLITGNFSRCKFQKEEGENVWRYIPDRSGTCSPNINNCTTYTCESWIKENC